MNEIISAAVSGLLAATVREYTAWLAKRARDAAWKPSPQDAEDFIAEVLADTPAAVKARVAASLGIPWPPPAAGGS